MKRIILVALLAGCTVPPETRGEVSEVTENMVVIRGAYDMDLTTAPAAPTPAMVDQAREICLNAQYLTAEPSNLHEYDYNFLYKFRCPTGPKRG